MVEGEQICIANASATKKIKRTTHRGIDPASAQFLDTIEILKAMNAASIRHGDGTVLAEKGDQIFVNAFALTLDINCMDEKLIAMRGKVVKRFRCDV